MSDSEIKKLLIALGCCHWNQGEDGFGGEWEVKPNNVELVKAWQQGILVELLCALKSADALLIKHGFTWKNRVRKQIASAILKAENGVQSNPKSLPSQVWCECGHISGQHGVDYPHICATGGHDGCENGCKGFKASKTPKCVCGEIEANPCHSKEWCLSGIVGAHAFTPEFKSNPKGENLTSSSVGK